MRFDFAQREANFEKSFYLPFCTSKWQVKMIKYEVILYWSTEDNAFIAEVPELPGCMADGATYREALTNVEQIAQEWIETARELGREIPVSKGKLVYA